MIALLIDVDLRQVRLEVDAVDPVLGHFQAADADLCPFQEISMAERWQIISTNHDAGRSNNKRAQTLIVPTFRLIIAVVLFPLPINP